MLEEARYFTYFTIYFSILHALECEFPRISFSLGALRRGTVLPVARVERYKNRKCFGILFASIFEEK